MSLSSSSSFELRYPYLGIERAKVLHAVIYRENLEWLKWTSSESVDSIVELFRFEKEDLELDEGDYLELCYSPIKIIYTLPEQPDKLYVLCNTYDNTSTSFSQSANGGRAVVRAQNLTFGEKKSTIMTLLIRGKEYPLRVFNTPKTYKGVYYEDVVWVKMDRLQSIPDMVFQSPTIFFQQLVHLFRSLISLRKPNNHTSSYPVYNYQISEVRDVKLENTGWCPKAQSLRLFDVDYYCHTEHYDTRNLFNSDIGDYHFLPCEDLRTMLGCMIAGVALKHDNLSKSIPKDWKSIDEMLDILRDANYDDTWCQVVQGIIQELSRPIVEYRHACKYYLHEHNVMNQPYSDRSIECIERGLMCHEDKYQEPIEVVQYETEEPSMGTKMRAKLLRVRDWWRN